LDEIKKRVDIKESTKHYWRQIVAALVASWPELPQKKLNAVTQGDCQTWTSRFAKQSSPTRYNKTVDALRAMFELGIRHRISLTIQQRTLGN
jgi:hypothetical protein